MPGEVKANIDQTYRETKPKDPSDRNYRELFVPVSICSMHNTQTSGMKHVCFCTLLSMTNM